MKRNYLLLLMISIFYFSNNVYSQRPLLSSDTTVRCETEIVDSTTFFNWPYFGNNQYLLNLADSVEGSGQMARYIPTILRIPVSAWVYHLNAGFTDNITDNVVEQYINAINQFYIANNVHIRLYLRCGINHIIDNTFYNGVNASNYNTMFNNHYTARTLNIHFTNGADGFARGRFPWKSNPFACYIPTFFTGVGNRLLTTLSNSLTHEVGHTLGLLHTHDGSRGNHISNALCGDCYQESVSRTRTQGLACISTVGKKKCEVNGDCLCDTDGDPLLQNVATGQVYVLPGCAGYDRTNSPYKKDRWDADWLPTGNNNAIVNIMSYSFDNCRTQMTPMQRGVEYFYALNKGAFPFLVNYTSFYQNDDVDDFENDNFFQNANPISLYTSQIHSFHLVPDQNSAYTGCDVDWVSFTPSCGGTLSVFTSKVIGKPLANTRVTLFNQALVQLAQNDDISPTNKFSKISYNFTAGTTYLIRIENMAPNSVGYYNITVGDNSIIGSDVLCISSTYSFADLPTGATVQWTSSPTGSVSFNPSNTRVTTASKISSGNVLITATISCNGVNYPVSKSIRVGGYGSGDYPVFGPSNASCNAYVTYSTNQLQGATNYAWFYPGSWTYISGQGTYMLTLRTNNSNGNYQVGVRVANTCDAGGSPAIKNTYVSGCNYAFIVSPNPATTTITINTTSGNSKINSSSSISEQLSISEINIYDQLGNLKIHRMYDKIKNVSLDVSNFPTGIYVIEIKDGAYKETQKLQILKN